MAAAETAEGWEVQCAYCFSSDKDMINPRRLPCGHVNCLKGIQNDFEAKKILQCPKCRKAFDKEPDELHIYCPGESPKSKLLCDLCVDDEQTAQVYCPACPKKMCKTHEKQHEVWFPDHKNVISAADYIRQSRRLTPQCCLKHDHQLILTCENCSTKFCERCEDTDDNCKTGKTVWVHHHKVVSIDKLSNRLRNLLKDVKTRAVVKETTYKDFAKECHQTLCDYDTETNMMVSAIRDTKGEQIRALEKGYDALEKSLCHQRKKDAINWFVEGQVEAKQRAVCNQILLIDTAIQDMHEIEVIDSHGTRISIVDKLVTEPMPSMNFRKVTKFKSKGQHRTIELELEKAELFTIGDTSVGNTVSNDYMEEGTCVTELSAVRPYPKFVEEDIHSTTTGPPTALLTIPQTLADHNSGSFPNETALPGQSSTVQELVDYPGRLATDEPEMLYHCPICRKQRKRNKRGSYSNMCWNCRFDYRQR